MGFVKKTDNCVIYTSTRTSYASSQNIREQNSHFYVKYLTYQFESTVFKQNVPLRFAMHHLMQISVGILLKNRRPSLLTLFSRPNPPCVYLTETLQSGETFNQCITRVTRQLGLTLRKIQLLNSNYLDVKPPASPNQSKTRAVYDRIMYINFVAEVKETLDNPTIKTQGYFGQRNLRL